MAISSSTRKAGPFLGNDAATVFPFAFKVFTATDLLVVNTSALGIESELVLDVDYTVELNSNQDNDPGGSVTRLAALPTGERLTITSDVAALQPLVLTNNGGFYPRVINDAFDKITIIAQQLIEQVGRSLKLPISSTASPTLPDPVPNGLLAWNSDASGFVNVEPGNLVSVAGYADARIEVYEGDGVETDFEIDFHPGVMANLDISLGGVTQIGGVDFTWLGTTVMFTEPPPAGVSILIRYARPLAPMPDFDAVITSVDAAQAAQAAAEAAAASVQINNTYSLLNVLTDVEKADVLAGTNAIDITAKLAALVVSLAQNRPGSVLDASMVRGTWTWTSDPLNPSGELGSAPITLRLGDVTIKKNFNIGPIILPSYFTLEIGPKTKFAPTVKIEAVPGDANPGVGMLTTHLVGGNNLSGTNGSAVVELDFAYEGRVNVGACLAIFGVAPLAQNAVAISGAIDADDTTITFASSMTEEFGGLAYIKIDNEIIRGVVSGTTMTGAVRGVNGTTAASHADAATATHMISRVYRVLDKSGVNVTLDAPLDRNLTGASWRCGSVGTRIVGSGLIDGELNRASPPSGTWVCLASTLSADFHVSGGLRLKGGGHGGLFIMGTRRHDVTVGPISGCGLPASGLGASFWLFGDVADGSVTVASVDDGNLGFAIDNKSFGVPEYGLIASCSKNRVDVGAITNHLSSYNLSAALNNAVRIGVNLSAIGILETSASQLVTPIPCVGNSVVVDAQPSVSGITVPNPTDNFISINGKTRREVSYQWTTGGIIYVGYDTNAEQVLGVAGVKAGDEISIRPAAAIATLTGVSAYCVADGQIRIIFQSQSNGTKEIPAASVFNITARGPW